VYMEAATHSGGKGKQVLLELDCSQHCFWALWQIQGNEQPHYCTKYKTYGGALCSMGVALILPPP
jgi:hypothetical protein